MDQLTREQEFEPAQLAPLSIDDFVVSLPPSMGGPREPAMDLARCLDIAIAIAAIVFTAPLLITIALMVWSHDGGSPLFSQDRIGFGGRRFRCLKFRSMIMGAEGRLRAVLEANPDARREWSADHKLRRDPRITPIGRFLRQSSLDELPQLFNVLRGEMSLVGPRPIVAAEICRYGRRFRSYCSVRPGLTGLWQVSGRNDTSYRRRIAYDVLYARRRTTSLNLAIILKTAPAVIGRRGCY